MTSLFWCELTEQTPLVALERFDPLEALSTSIWSHSSDEIFESSNLELEDSSELTEGFFWSSSRRRKFIVNNENFFFRISILSNGKKMFKIGENRRFLSKTGIFRPNSEKFQNP